MIDSVYSLIATPEGQVLALGGLCALLVLILGVVGCRQRRLQRQLRLMQQHLHLMRQQLDSLQARLNEVPATETPVKPQAAEAGGFGATLQAVEQQGVAARPGYGAVTERYRYVASLAEQGMDAPQIARALHIAPAEAEQALRLAAIARSSAKPMGKSKEMRANGREEE